jgi:Flp pilus assembly protein TadG
MRYEKMETKGQALVEMSIVILLLFLLVLGIFQFGWLMYIKNTLNNAARASVRTAVVTANLNTSGDTNISKGTFTSNCSGITDPVQSQICKSLFYVNKSNVSAIISSTHNPAQSGDTVTVSITLSPVDWFAGNIISSSFLKNGLSGSASMRYE